jgi:hypothetical protein
LSSNEGFAALMQKLPDIMRDIQQVVPYSQEEIRAIQQKLTSLYK